MSSLEAAPVTSLNSLFGQLPQLGTELNAITEQMFYVVEQFWGKGNTRPLEFGELNSWPLSNKKKKK